MFHFASVSYQPIVGLEEIFVWHSCVLSSDNESLEAFCTVVCRYIIHGFWQSGEPSLNKHKNSQRNTSFFSAPASCLPSSQMATHCNFYYCHYMSRYFPHPSDKPSRERRVCQQCETTQKVCQVLL